MVFNLPASLSSYYPISLSLASGWDKFSVMGTKNVNSHPQTRMVFKKIFLITMS